MRTIYLYIQDTLADWEPAHILAELRSGHYLKDPSLKYDLVLCGRTMETITTMGGLRLKPDVLIADIHPGPGNLLLLPGAETWLDPVQVPVIAKAREVLEGDAVVAAICGATFGLANAGLLNDRPHTSNDLAVLKSICPGYSGERFYVNEPAVTDRNLVTACGAAPVEFAYQVFKALGVMLPETLEAWNGVYTTKKPEYFYALMQSLPHQSH